MPTCQNCNSKDGAWVKHCDLKIRGQLLLKWAYFTLTIKQKMAQAIHTTLTACPSTTEFSKTTLCRKYLNHRVSRSWADITGQGTTQNQAYQLFTSDIQVDTQMWWSPSLASYTDELNTKTYVIMLHILFSYLIEQDEARTILFHPVPCPFCHVRMQAALARALVLVLPFNPSL